MNTDMEKVPIPQKLTLTIREAALSQLPVCFVRRGEEAGQASGVRGIHQDAGDHMI